MTAPTTKPGKRVVFITASNGKPAAKQTAMLKSIDGHTL
jgi:hypothetical protein